MVSSVIHILEHALSVPVLASLTRTVYGGFSRHRPTVPASQPGAVRAVSEPHCLHLHSQFCASAVCGHGRWFARLSMPRLHPLYKKMAPSPSEGVWRTRCENIKCEMAPKLCQAPQKHQLPLHLHSPRLGSEPRILGRNSRPGRRSLHRSS